MPTCLLLGVEVSGQQSLSLVRQEADKRTAALLLTSTFQHLPAHYSPPNSPGGENCLTSIEDRNNDFLSA